jgi:hypothetical protein
VRVTSLMARMVPWYVGTVVTKYAIDQNQGAVIRRRENIANTGYNRLTISA